MDDTEQVIDVPKISCPDGLPPRAVLVASQMAEQLVCLGQSSTSTLSSRTLRCQFMVVWSVVESFKVLGQSSTACGGGGLQGFPLEQGSAPSSSVHRSSAAALNAA